MSIGPQKVAENIGKSGCLYLCYIKLAHLLNVSFINDCYILSDAVTSYDYLLNKGIIDADCYVNDPVALVKHIMPDKEFSIEKVYEIPNDTPDYIVTYNGKHFTIANKDGEIVWDPLGEDHIAVTKLTPAKSYRILRKVK